MARKKLPDVIPDQQRQGDILFHPAQAIPAEAEPASSPVIARGEVTGHCHAVRKTSAGRLLVLDRGMYIDAKGGVHIDHTHESHLGDDMPPTADHFALTLGRVLYDIRRQREYTPEGNRDVND